MKAKTKALDFRRFFLNKSAEQRTLYAEQSGTTKNYIEHHLVTRYKIPRPKLINKLAEASDGTFTRKDLIDFFYEEKEKVPN